MCPGAGGHPPHVPRGSAWGWARLGGAPERSPGPEGTPRMCPGAMPGAGRRSGCPGAVPWAGGQGCPRAVPWTGGHPPHVPRGGAWGWAPLGGAPWRCPGPEGTHRIPDQLQFTQLRWRRNPAKNPHAFSAPLAHSGRAQRTCSAAIMSALSAIDAGTPAPAIRLPLDPAPAHPRERPFSQESGKRLDLKRDRQRCGDGPSPKRPVCHNHRPRPQLPT